MPIEANCFVVLRYELRSKAGDVIDDGEEQLEYVHGYGTLVPGLEANLVGMQRGDKKTIALEPFEAFGDRDEELVFSVERDELPEGTNAGDELAIEGPEGGQFDVRVKSLDAPSARGGVAVLDANHPLAGLSVVFEVEVLEVRAATESEIREAAGALQPGVIQIGRKPAKPME